MKTNSSNIIFIIIIVAVIGGGIYFYKNKGSDATIEEVPVDTASIGSDIYALLAQLNSLKIDSEIFVDPAYQSLNDYTSIVRPEVQGRKNPFAPLPGTAVVKTTKKK